MCGFRDGWRRRLDGSGAKSAEGHPAGPWRAAPQPGDEAWTFIEDLKLPLWGNGLGWSQRAVAADEADLSRGVRVNATFPDVEGVLKTAYADLADFCAAAKLPADGPYVIETAKAQTRF